MKHFVPFGLSLICLIGSISAGPKLVEVMMEPTQFFRLQRTDMAKLKAEIENEIKSQVRMLDRQYSTYRQMRDSQVAAPPATGYPGMQNGPPSPFPFYMVQQAQKLLANNNKVAHPNDAKVDKLTTQLNKLNNQIGDLKGEIKKAKVMKQKAQSKETTIVHTSNDEVSKVDSVSKVTFKEKDDQSTTYPDGQIVDTSEEPFINMIQTNTKQKPNNTIKEKLFNGPIIDPHFNDDKIPLDDQEEISSDQPTRFQETDGEQEEKEIQQQMKEKELVQQQQQTWNNQLKGELVMARQKDKEEFNGPLQE